MIYSRRHIIYKRVREVDHKYGIVGSSKPMSSAPRVLVIFQSDYD